MSDWPRWYCPVGGCEFTTHYIDKIRPHLQDQHGYSESKTNFQYGRFKLAKSLKDEGKDIIALCTKDLDDPAFPEELKSEREEHGDRSFFKGAEEEELRKDIWPLWYCPVSGCTYRTCYWNNIKIHLRDHGWKESGTQFKHQLQLFRGAKRRGGNFTVCEKTRDDPTFPKKLLDCETLEFKPKYLSKSYTIYKGKLDKSPDLPKGGGGTD